MSPATTRALSSALTDADVRAIAAWLIDHPEDAEPEAPACYCAVCDNTGLVTIQSEPWRRGYTVPCGDCDRGDALS